MKQILPETISYWLFTRCAHQIVDAASELAALGWTPATSGNFSMQVDDRHVAITISGRNKAHLCHDDIMLIDQQGRAVGNDARPSAETLLHSQIYRRWPIMQVVIHTHSRTQSVASRLFAKSGMVKLRGWELQKAIAGYHSHEEVLEIPVFSNRQHIPELVTQVDRWIETGKALFAYLIDGHGLYTWGRDMDEARRHLEALEFLLACELDVRNLSA